MPREPQVAIIMPLYNKRAWIARALHSVINQTWTDWALVVVDDGSTDGSADVVAALRHPQIRLIRQANAGPGAARNTAIAASRSEWLAFLDADDEWLPDYLDTAMRNLAAHPGINAHLSGYLMCPDGRTRTPFLPHETPKPGIWQWPSPLDEATLAAAYLWWHSDIVVVRRSVVEAVGGFYAAPGCTFGEDSYLWLQVALSNSVFREPGLLCNYSTDASELGVGRRTAKPPEPILFHHEKLFSLCPAAMKPVVASFLESLAYRAAWRQAAFGEPRDAREIIRQYPGLRQRGFKTVQLYWQIWTNPARRWLRRTGWRPRSRWQRIMRGVPPTAGSTAK